MKKLLLILTFTLLILICAYIIYAKIKAHNQLEVINNTYAPPLQLRLQSDITGRGMVVDTLHSEIQKLDIDLIQYGDIVPEPELKDQLSNMYIMLAFQRNIDSLRQSRDNNEILYLRTRNDRYRVIGNKSDDNRVKMVKRYNKFIATLK